MTSSIPRSGIDATDQTSRSAFRRLARCIDATNRDADTLRHSLIAQWSERAGAHKLDLELQSLALLDPDEAESVEARLAVWFSLADPEDGRLVTEDDPVLAGLSDELRKRLAGIARPLKD